MLGDRERLDGPEKLTLYDLRHLGVVLPIQDHLIRVVSLTPPSPLPSHIQG